MTLEEIKTYIKRVVEFQFPDWSAIQRMAEEAMQLENQDHSHKEEKVE